MTLSFIAQRDAIKNPSTHISQDAMFPMFFRFSWGLKCVMVKNSYAATCTYVQGTTNICSLLLRESVPSHDSAIKAKMRLWSYSQHWSLSPSSSVSISITLPPVRTTAASLSPAGLKLNRNAKKRKPTTNEIPKAAYTLLGIPVYFGLTLQSVIISVQHRVYMTWKRDAT